jgi:DNA-binding NtrC family response regulator
MTRKTILYISDQATNSDPALAGLNTAGYEVVSTKSAMQAIALLFILHPVAAIILHSRQDVQTSCDMARSLRAIRGDVPIVLLSCAQIGRMPSFLDAWVSTGQPEKLASTIRLLTANRSPRSAQNADLEVSRQ